ncbi:PilW family protein [Phytopseudomonas dryadis]|uniref:Uncharacterized protein n=1 Tax=Phytopseudomonas dryadis TaxID=2487520 RepID=A0ABY1ZDP8_9GAMM|nr:MULTISPECIES: hypothetical protein [Pseudomonas]TBV09061.1 hypothetical protein DNK34_03800 [Pseudomonas dryadis]TBV18276.1 hypothetical protein DNK41_09495 [Pseudomonas sp. FRB 230]
MRQLNNQHGITLVSLMVGTVLSMLTILAMLALYKNLIQVAVVATKDANHDGQLASALLVAQLELQSAGFGMDGTVADAFYLPTAKPALLWRYRTNPDNPASSWCMGLLDRPSSGGSRTLTLLKKSNCNDALSARSLADDTATLKASWQDDGVIDLATLMPTTTGPLLAFEKNDAVACSTFSSSDGALHPLITLKAMSSSALASSATSTPVQPISYRVCLSNLVSTSP